MAAEQKLNSVKVGATYPLAALDGTVSIGTLKISSMDNANAGSRLVNNSVLVLNGQTFNDPLIELTDIPGGQLLKVTVTTFDEGPPAGEYRLNPRNSEEVREVSRAYEKQTGQSGNLAHGPVATIKNFLQGKGRRKTRGRKQRKQKKRKTHRR
jgi:hypothetical protein